MSRDEFDALAPFDRGYAVYMCGENEEQPNVPDESNPYAPGSPEHKQWRRGNEHAAAIAGEWP